MQAYTYMQVQKERNPQADPVLRTEQQQSFIDACEEHDPDDPFLDSWQAPDSPVAEPVSVDLTGQMEEDQDGSDMGSIHGEDEPAAVQSLEAKEFGHVTLVTPLLNVKSYGQIVVMTHGLRSKTLLLLHLANSLFLYQDSHPSNR